MRDGIIPGAVMSVRSVLVIMPAPRDDSGVGPETTIAGLPLLRRIALTARRAGFDHVFVHPLVCPDPRRLDDTGARMLGADPAARFGPATRVVLLPVNVLPQIRWLRALREAPLAPDTVALDDSSAAAIESRRAGELLEAARRATTIAELIVALPDLSRVSPVADPKGRLALATAAHTTAAEDWLLRGLVRETESFMSRHVERPISLALTRRLVATRITPNAMTLMSLAAGLLGAPFFLSGDWSYQLSGALLLLTHSILDGCDGELARLKFLESRSGALLDFWGDNLVHVAVFGCMAGGWALATGAAWPLLIGAVAVAGTLAAATSMMSRQAIRTREFGDDLAGRVTKALANRDFIYLVVLLALLGRAHWFLALVAAGSPIFVTLAWLGNRVGPHRMKPRTLAAVLVLVILGASRGVEGGEATDYIRARIDKVYDILRRTGGDAGPDRNAAAGKVLDEMFDWNEMGRRSLGRYWGERTPAERTEFVSLFAALFQRTYLSRIELADREKFQYLDEAIEGDTATVKTMVITKKGSQIPVDYLARRAGTQWKVYDISASGTSLVGNYRAQFTSLVARSSYEDLITKLRELAGQRPGGEPRSGGVTLVGAGDIASCGSDGDEATAELIDRIDGVVFTVGDHAYESGNAIEFAACYEPSWGRHRARTRPSPGNHDYESRDASDYFRYFGDRAGDPARGYYRYELGTWQIFVLNSNCAEIGGCEAGSRQEQWLRAQLTAHPAQCTLAYWHHPRFSSGRHGGEEAVGAFWQALYEYGAEIVLNGHDHVYERFAPQTPSGEPDPGRGLRQFTVGTGGAKLHKFDGRPEANSEARDDRTFGVLELVLHPTGYEWRFVPVAGGTFTDSGTDRCR
jgi:ABC-type transporter MlaC component